MEPKVMGVNASDDFVDYCSDFQVNREPAVNFPGPRVGGHQPLGR